MSSSVMQPSQAWKGSRRWATSRLPARTPRTHSVVPNASNAWCDAGGATGLSLALCVWP
eukprot:CAMPEP_0185158246 /NCGR_PEP_ID=MMETSP1139-20130426/2291_1 /TAXON_ID=298111 /ORGANISM="Pavlova sp., Strain CCMP459" /LENGTH=58 /DNA_ID=CAMNT_0027723373 /DNA_START=53 /DNA_END=226 /DNA_ORIENTATION=-